MSPLITFRDALFLQIGINPGVLVELGFVEGHPISHPWR